MIQQLREQSQNIFFKILLGFIAITFVVSFGVGSFFGEQKDVIATVGSSEILNREFSEVYNQRLQIYRNQFGENADQFAQQFNLQQQVFDQLVDRHLQLNEAEAQGLRVTKEELRDYITSLPYFQKDGVFDEDTYFQILSQNRLVVDDFEKQAQSDLLVQKYQDSLMAGIVVSEAEVERQYKSENETFEIDYVYFDSAKFLDQATYTDEDLQKYYTDRPEEFEQSKQFKIEYFTLNLDQFRETAEAKEREIERYYERNEEEYTTPPEVKARHILIRAASDLSEEQKNEKRQQAETILAELKGGADFETLAKEKSEDFSKEQGGDLGWFKPGEMVPAFDTAAFSLEPGKISDVVESSFGFHIIRVDDKKPEAKKTLEEARPEIVEILKERRAEKKLELEYDRLQERMETENDMKAIASSFGTEAVQTDLFDRESIVDGLGSVRVLVSQLNDEVVDGYGRWKRNPVQGYVFYKILEVKEPSTKPFDTVKDDVIAAVKNEKAQVLAAETATKEMATISDKGLNSLVDTYQLEVKQASLTVANASIPGVGNDPEFKKNVIALKEANQYGSSQHENKAYIFMLKQRSLPDADAKSKKDNIRQRLVQQLRRAYGERDTQRLRETGKIEILNTFFQNPGNS